MSYGHYRDVWQQLVQRMAKDTPQEHWVLLPGFEEPARELFTKAVADSLSKDAVLERVKGLQRQYFAAECEKAKAAQVEAKAKAEAERTEAEKARREALAAQAAAEQADAKAEAAADADAEKAQLTAAAEKAREELLAKQRAAVEAQVKADAEARAAAKADTDAKAKVAAEAKETKAVERAADKAAQKALRGTVDAHLLAVGKAGTAKDVATMAAELITGADAPDDVLEELLHLLHRSKELSGKAKRAVDAALVVLTRNDRPTAAKPSTSPVAVAAALHTPSTQGRLGGLSHHLPERSNLYVPA